MLAALTIVAGMAGCAPGASLAPTSAVPTIGATPALVPPSQAVVVPTDPVPTASAGVPLCQDAFAVSAGRRHITPAMTETPIGLEITFTDGWKGCGLAFKELGPPAGLMMIGYWDSRMVYANPCHWKADVGDPDTGPTIEDLMQAIEAQKLTAAGPTEEVTIDGYSGKYIRFEVAPDLDASDCDRDKPDLEAEFRLWNGPGESVWWLGAADAPGLIGEVWAIDVDGFRFVIQAASFGDAPEARRNEIHEIVASIDLLP
jgi:hypothetical protein